MSNHSLAKRNLSRFAHVTPSCLLRGIEETVTVYFTKFLKVYLHFILLRPQSVDLALVPQNMIKTASTTASTTGNGTVSDTASGNFH